ncbi:AAA family ATPase [Thalassotalea profundi]|uniref:ATPase dynein-related AAA domain-containing protein n=1 Tax=Thalassotalea profundi TaxID=2036687 RepID=A0ABQ3IJ38_9GAMM|nr:AAA family ATPase [Thalassotalea profundi]GHE85926.1 hypothetical protein GCM10011501_13880 [Thalassotalea profundi]
MHDLKNLWDEFLTTWSIDRVKNMTLEEYVGFADKTTFTYWLETKTHPIANINGSPSYKFGIYKRNPNKEIKEKAGTKQGEEYSWYSRFGDTEQEAFIAIRKNILTVINASQNNDLNTIENVSLSNMFKWKIAFLYQNRNSPTIVNIFSKDKLDELTGLSGKPSFSDYYQELVSNYNAEDYESIAEYGKELWLQSEVESNADAAITRQYTDNSIDIQESPLNQIFYGPPGTGKTYHTPEAAVKAAEPIKYQALGIDKLLGATPAQQAELRELYKSLTDAGRIRFVTFHQSYGYEEFVEGLKAFTNEDKQVEYEVIPGVFKKISEDAEKSKEKKNIGLKPSARVWKISIDGVNHSPVRDYCLQNGLAAIGWGDTGDMRKDERSESENEYFANLSSTNRNTIDNFCSRITEGELILCISSAKTIQAIGVVKGEYEYRENGILGRKDFCHTLPVEWLVTDTVLDIYELNNNINLVQKTVYELDRFSTADLLKKAEENGITLNKDCDSNSEDNYVLIIDEINRGNISKIFGELITLIEPSKRSGLDKNGKENREALYVHLPHTPHKKFSVPSNLYLIGTMNTADRSLAMMDTALRRRFDFVEMMPKPQLFKGKKVHNIDLQQLLEVMNERIEVLYDREHTLGHAFFMPVINVLDDKGEDDAFIELQKVFKNKIIPLLEEYFFEDWNKIRLVLGDNRKNSQTQSQYVFIQQSTASYNDIFGEGHGLETYEDKKTTYKLTDFNDENSSWQLPLAYQAIYDVSVLKKTDTPTNSDEELKTSNQ